MDWSEVWSRGPLVDGLRIYGLDTDAVLRAWMGEDGSDVRKITYSLTELQKGALAELLDRVAPEGSAARWLLEESGVDEETRTAAREHYRLDDRWKDVVQARTTKREWRVALGVKQRGT